jgi:two-component system, NarL family, response regulator NreC
VSEANNEENGAPTKVLVVDDHSVTRHGVVLLCTAAEGVEVIGEASDGNEAIQRVTELLPDVVLMDVAMASARPSRSARTTHRSGWWC